MSSPSSTTILSTLCLLTIPLLLLLRRTKNKQIVDRITLGAVGGLGPQATVHFFAEFVRSRIDLHNFIVHNNSNPLPQNIPPHISSCTWSTKEIESLFQQQTSKTTTSNHNLKDQDHVPMILYNAPFIPPRPDFILGKSHIDPVPDLIQVIDSLVRAGATHIGIVCSTAHYFQPDIEKFCVQNNVQFIDIIRLTFQCLVNWGETEIGLLATEATLKTKLYQNVGKEFNISIKTLLDLDSSSNSILKEFQDTIFSSHGIKSGYDRVGIDVEANESFNTLLKESIALSEIIYSIPYYREKKRKKIIVLGCTELPVLINQENLKQCTKTINGTTISLEQQQLLNDIVFIDPARILADYVTKLHVLYNKNVM
jgi:aspartate/glutamate racemase